MGSIYRPKYKNKAGELVESAVWWLKFRANGRVVRESSGTTKETEGARDAARQGRRRGARLVTPPPR